MKLVKVPHASNILKWRKINNLLFAALKMGLSRFTTMVNLRIKTSRSRYSMFRRMDHQFRRMRSALTHRKTRIMRGQSQASKRTQLIKIHF